jgi:hypothetical protein
MNCRHVWNREFLDTHLTRSWREGKLKRHRATLLFDRERSMLPATQPAVEIELQKREVAKEYEAIAYKLMELKSAVAQLEAERERQQYFMRHGRWPEETEEIKEKPVRHQFIAPCPVSDCRGFLSTSYKCGTCQKQFCSACRELQTEAHTCDPALVETIKAITKDSRACPSCGTAISRVSGCDQMWCTQCDTPFSYRTGERLTGTIHNPHYFERLQKMGAALIQGPLHNHCPQGLPTYHSLLNVRADYIKGHLQTLFRKLYQAAAHVQAEVMPSLSNPATPADNTDLRVKYLLKELDDHQFKLLLQQRDRKCQKEVEIRDCLGLFLALCTDFYQAFHNRNFLTATLQETALRTLVENIEKHVNEPLRAIGDRYANIVPQIITEIKKGESDSGFFVGQGYRPVKKAPAAYSKEESEAPAIISHQAESGLLHLPK